ncbi:MAG: IS3 family transposase [Armatimonadota bacterium]
MLAKAKRRQFAAEYKRRIVREADAARDAGEIGALLRREGLYSSHLATWRRARERGELAGLSPKRRGRKEKVVNPLAKRLAELERDKRRLERRLKQAELLLEIQKKAFAAAGDSAREPRRRRRERLMQAAEELSSTSGTLSACRALGVVRSTLYRHRGRSRHPAIRARAERSHPRALALGERQAVLAELRSERFVDQAPAAVYAALLDEGRYLCSERTMYRLLSDAGELRERRDQLRHPAYAKPELLATRPNELWSWDITKLLGPAKWTYFYLYVLLDVFSRYVVGWMVAHRESAMLAKRLIEASLQKQAIEPGQLTVHADRGSSMTSKPVALMLADLGVTKTHSRPQVSNDNPFSEAQFKTLKYRPEFPDRFGCIEDSRAFCVGFFHWYNNEHYHSGLALLTPATVHYGRTTAVLAQRREILASAYVQHPERFVRRAPRPAEPPIAVWINPPKPTDGNEDLQ